MAHPSAKSIQDLNQAISNNSEFDAVIVISPMASYPKNQTLHGVLSEAAKVDRRLGNQAVLIHSSEIAGGRLIHSPTGSLKKDYDDVRNFADAAKKATIIAKDAGAKNLLMVVSGVPNSSDYQFALESCYLGACQALWQPLEARQSLTESEIEPVQTIGLFDVDNRVDCDYLNAAEAGRRVARDLCGTEPERMAPIGFAGYCANEFSDSAVNINVIADREHIAKEYPLFEAVARASYAVERHHPRIIELSYQGKGPIKKTLMLVGKAVTYDTGGADVKTGGHMAGMSRDKGGGAAVAGFMKTLAMLQPEGIKVVAKIAAVRNSIGADAYVADEIITGHSGKRVRIGNTDAEGRLAMIDSLSHFRQQAVDEVNPCLFTVATLTGHALLAAGPYTILVENGYARQNGVGNEIAEHGEAWGDGCQISLSRREDWDIIKPRTKADDVLSSNNGPSVSVPRGHQFPMAFLSEASGLEEHSKHSEQPIAYVHVDIAGSGVEGLDWQHGKPTASPVLALAATYLRQ